MKKAKLRQLLKEREKLQKKEQVPEKTKKIPQKKVKKSNEVVNGK